MRVVVRGQTCMADVSLFARDFNALGGQRRRRACARPNLAFITRVIDPSPDSPLVSRPLELHGGSQPIFGLSALQNL